MAGFLCCIWWFLLGALIGWLASWLVGRMIGSAAPVVTAAPVFSAPPVAPPPPVAAAAPVAVIDVAAAKRAGFVVTGWDNFEVIEGIGPKIANLLRTNGVTSFAQLAGMSRPAIQAILDKGGERFKLAVPETWAEQAALAAANRWSDLRGLQDMLDAGSRHGK